MTRNSVYTMVKVLSQKVEDGFKNLEEKIDKIESHTGKINGCLRDNELRIAKLDTGFAGHIKNHRRDLTILGFFITIIAIAIGIIVQVML